MSQKPWEYAKSSGSEGDPLAARFVSSLDYDKRLYKHDIAGSIAHARMLRKVELIDDADLAAIEAGLNEIKQEIAEQGDTWPGWKVELEDVHMCVEAALIEKAGDAGRKLHTGRSRNDQVALDLLLWSHEAVEVIVEKKFTLMRAFVGLADQYGGVVMPSYTHLQRAQPIVVGGEVVAWLEALGQCSTRVEQLASMHRNPLGSGAIAGSSLPLDRGTTTKQLFPENDMPEEITGAFQEMFGLGDDLMQSVDDATSFSRSSIYGTASRDVALDMAYGLSMTSQWLSRWAEQWIIYATTEFGFITLDNLYTTGSSMMPQKQNPDMLELIRGKTGQVYGSLMALLTMCKGITIGYNRDLQEDKRHVFAAYDAVCDCLDMAAAIVRTTTFNEERIKAGLNRGYLDATSLAEYLVTQGVPFRTSHQVVGALVQLCEVEGLGELRKLSLEQIRGAVEEAGAKPQAAGVGEEVYGWLGPENVVQRYQSAGNAGVSGFEAQLAAWKERLGDSG
ncbi:MAG: argininosuccinate lyase [Planctomycetota bacterium]